MPETVLIKMNQTWALPSRKPGLEGRTDIDGKRREGLGRHRNLWGGVGGGVDMVRKKFPEKGSLALVLGRALGGSRG